MKHTMELALPVFAFNIWDIDSARAVIDAANEESRNVILQTSAGVFRDIPRRQLREFVASYTEKMDIQVWLHLDHCKDFRTIKEAIENGWDIVMFDGSDEKITDNIKKTNQITEYAHGRNVLVEAEIGQVGGVEEDIAALQGRVASKEDIDLFIKETDVDLIAAAFGNAHGIYKGEPALHYELIEYTANATKKPFVVHGGSGLSDETIRRLLGFPNVKKINISTDVKMSYRQGIIKAYERGMFSEEGFQAVKIEKQIYSEIKSMARRKIGLLNMT